MHNYEADVLSQPSDKTFNILLVEDDPFDTVLIRRKVSEYLPGCVITNVHSLQEAYSAYKQRQVDIILLDLNLPDAYGQQTVSEIRKINKRIPIVVITGMRDNLIIEESLRQGASTVILKNEILEGGFAKILADYREANDQRH